MLLGNLYVAMLSAFMCFFSFVAVEIMLKRTWIFVPVCMYVCVCMHHVSNGIMSEWQNKSTEKVSLVSAHSFLWVTDGVADRM